MGNVLKDKCILMTGCSGGIGKAMLTALVENGANVFALTRRNPWIWELDLEETHLENLHWINVDLRNWQEAHSTVSEWLEGCGKVPDVFIHSAVSYGSTGRRTIQEISLDEWVEVTSVNFNSYFVLLKLIVPRLLKNKKGLIVNVTSKVVFNAGPGRADYASTKAASNSLSESLQKEICGYGIRVIGMPEGMVDTPGIRRRRPVNANLTGYASPNSLRIPIVQLVKNYDNDIHYSYYVIDAKGNMYPMGATPLCSNSRIKV